jgi:hypothetical protein
MRIDINDIPSIFSHPSIKVLDASREVPLVTLGEIFGVKVREERTEARIVDRKRSKE